MTKYFYRFFLVVSLLALPQVVLAATYHNDLPQKQWTTFGVNPWSVDTDTDGYTDAWEVKNKYCPTNPERGVRLDSGLCQKGSIDLKKQLYIAPPAVAAVLPAALIHPTSCNNLKEIMEQSVTAPTSTPFIPTDLVIGRRSVLPDYPYSGPPWSPSTESDALAVKTPYIFYGYKNIVSVVKTTPGTRPGLVAHFALSDIEAVYKLYASGSYVLVVGRHASPLGSDFTAAELWRVSDPTKPKLIRHWVFPGTLEASERKNGFVHLALVNRADPTDVVPLYQDMSGSVSRQISFGSCSSVEAFSPVRDHRSGFLHLITLPINGGSQSISTKTIAGFGNQGALLAFFDSHFYLATAHDADKTELFQFALSGSKIVLNAARTMPGLIIGGRSFNEYKGNLQVATEMIDPASGKTKNSLYFFDRDLTKIGWYEGFASAASMAMVNFFGNRALAWPWNVADAPLIFDLSNPRSIRELGRLQLPSFYSYVFPLSQNRLFAMGNNLGTNTSTVGVPWQQGMKLGLFDSSDLAAPRLIEESSIGDRGTNSRAFYSRDSILFSNEKNIIALPVAVTTLTAAEKSATDVWYPYVSGMPTSQALYVYHSDTANQLRFVGAISHTDLNAHWNPFDEMHAVTRSAIIGGRLYVFSPTKITVHDTNDLTTIKEINLISP